MSKFIYIAIAILLSGCTTALSIYEIKESGSAKCNRSEITSPIYSGTRCAANNAGAPGDLLSGIDLILCIPADTIVLPYTIYLNSQLANETTNI